MNTKKYFADYCSLGGDVFVDFSTGRIATNGDANLNWTVNLVETGLATGTGGRIKRPASHLRDATFMLTWGDGVQTSTCAGSWTFATHTESLRP